MLIVDHRRDPGALLRCELCTATGLAGRGLRAFVGPLRLGIGVAPFAALGLHVLVLAFAPFGLHVLVVALSLHVLGTGLGLVLGTLVLRLLVGLFRVLALGRARRLLFVALSLHVLGTGLGLVLGTLALRLLPGLFRVLALGRARRLLFRLGLGRPRLGL